MANQTSLPFYEKHRFKYNFKRVIDVLILILLLLLLGDRVISLVNNYRFHWLVVLICESWFTLGWIFTITTQWNPATIKTYPERLLQRLQLQELPAVDLFVTTADPVLEPPIMTVNTVLSLLAMEYPSDKLACYVSDDACSPLTFYALQEASKFAKHWVPFCKKFNVQVRAPFKYFSHVASYDHDLSTQQFKQECLRMKDMYDNLSRRIEEACRTSIPSCRLDGDFAVFLNTQRDNHPTIIKIIWENKEKHSEGLPHLIYISREKKPKHPHHYKAGAMNALTKVSGLMTNAPIILNVDCDMFVNNAKIALHAMCVLLDPKGQKEVAFVQCPQQFYGKLKDDPLGNQMVVLFKYVASGLAGLQGPFYGGTNCFHRRKVIYGLSPDEAEKGNMSEKKLKQEFGASEELVKSAADVLEGRTYSPNHDINISKSLESANQVAICGYEYATGWGDQIGWKYGSITEDVLTGLSIHKKGWRSEFCTPEPIAFTGCAPIGLPTSMGQQKRWATGMIEIFFNKKYSPLVCTIFGKLHFRQFLAYMWIMNWGFQPIFEASYVCLLTYCILTNSNFMPQGPALSIPITLVVIYMLHTILEYLATKLSIQEWWNNQRMSRIYIMNARFSGFLALILKLLRISNTVFDITRKDQNFSSDDGEDCLDNNINDDAGTFTFDESSVFVPGTTILLMQLAAMVIKIIGLVGSRSGNNNKNNGYGSVCDMLCSLYLILCYWPFLRGIFRRGKYGIPFSTIFKSATLAFLFVSLCTQTQTISG
ncbi:hypothetical protein HN873_007364 [Arachis hypogaea]|uniref:Glycosyltransferase 2-like domain-containing protein n=1 Tax=Arachis hypogaea TaxID=3818 RepID=A0A445E1A6_ARAHY|nr:Cellulose synthase-like protein [Arachis hypogaea]RYR69184.1 hypothetical protein Ahy_A03g015720 [Arachis hypogaea]